MSILLYSSHLIAFNFFSPFAYIKRPLWAFTYYTFYVHIQFRHMLFARIAFICPYLMSYYIWYTVQTSKNTIRNPMTKLLLVSLWVNFKLFMVYLGILYVKGFMKWYLVYVKVRGLMLNHVKRSIFRML